MRIYKSFFRFEKCRKACKYRLYRLMRTYKEIVKNYILIYLTYNTIKTARVQSCMRAECFLNVERGDYKGRMRPAPFSRALSKISLATAISNTDMPMLEQTMISSLLVRPSLSPAIISPVSHTM